MLLTLEVISPNGEVLGSNRRKTVGPEGAQIGRSKENDWVLSDQYISRLQARVRYVNGAFYIEGLGRNPLAVNDAANTVPNNDPQLLRNGDRVFLDQYEIKVTLSSGQTRTAGVPEDPFAVEPTVSPPAVPSSWSGGGSMEEIAIQDGEHADAGNLDPLAALGGAASRAPAGPKHVELEQRSVLEDSFRAPQPVSPAPGADGQIPDAWDRSRFTKMEQPAPPPARTPAAPPPKRGGSAAAPAAGGAIPDAWDRSGLTQMEQQRRSAQPAPTPQPPQTPQRTTKTSAPKTVRREMGTTQVPPPPAEAPRPAAPPDRQPRTEAQPAAGGAQLGLDQVLRAAGVPASQMSPELAAELGQVLRIVVQGLMEVLQSRAEIKSQLRMSMTRMQPTENNPLKFSPNVEAALHTLLVERNRGYLPTTRAFQEALADIRDHQIAVLQGIRVAFDAMLENFDPRRLEEDMDRGSKRGGLLNVGAKSRFRDFYVEQFERWTSDPDETFRRLFGEEFAQAYEEQMDRLKATARTSGG